MSIGSKMRSLGDSTYFLKAAYEPLKEIMGDKNYVFEKDPINGYVIHTDRIDDELLENVDELLNDEFGSKFKKTHYNHHMDISWRDINKYAECKTEEDMKLINPNYRYDLTSDGWWVYPLPKYEGYHSVKENYYVWNNNETLTVIDCIIPKKFNPFYTNKAKNLIKVVWRDGYINNSFAVFRDNPNLEEVTADFSKIVTLDYYCFRGKVKIINSDWTSLKNMQREAMTSTQLNKESALRLFNTIPTWTDSEEHNIAIGIHIDYQNDEEVLSAIANAEAKGWDVAVRWNGTPTAQTTSTFGLRKPSIYAKLSEIERPDGSKEQILDWGHYVSNPENYEEFSSLEEAYAHFGLPNNTEN